MDFSDIKALIINEIFNKEDAEKEKANTHPKYYFYNRLLKQKIILVKFFEDKLKHIITSKEERKYLINNILRIVRLMHYSHDGVGKNIKKLEKEFVESITTVLDRLELKNRIKKSGFKIEFEGTMIKPLVVRSARPARKDTYCLYIKKCGEIARLFEGKLDCSNCDCQEKEPG